jgi:hypothetical protein
MVITLTEGGGGGGCFGLLEQAARQTAPTLTATAAHLGPANGARVLSATPLSKEVN